MAIETFCPSWRSNDLGDCEAPFDDATNLDRPYSLQSIPAYLTYFSLRPNLACKVSQNQLLVTNIVLRKKTASRAIIYRRLQHMMKIVSLLEAGNG